MRRILVVIATALGLAGLGASSPALAGTSLPAGTLIGAPQALPLNAPAGTSSGPYDIHNNAGGPLDSWMNDSGGRCTSNTPVIGWDAGTGTSNEAVYFNAAGGGVWTIHFQSCGNNWCVWQYGFGGTNNLYMHTCNGSANNDLFSITTDSNGEYYFTNLGDQNYITGHVNNEQLTTQGYAGNWSQWQLDQA